MPKDITLEVNGHHRVPLRRDYKY